MGYLDIIEVKKRINKIYGWDRENVFIEHGTSTNDNYEKYNLLFKKLYNTLIFAKNLNQYCTRLGLIKYLKDNTPSENYESSGLKESKDFLELVDCFVNVLDNGKITVDIHQLENIELETIKELFNKQVSLIYLRKIKIDKIRRI